MESGVCAILRTKIAFTSANEIPENLHVSNVSKIKHQSPTYHVFVFVAFFIWFTRAWIGCFRFNPGLAVNPLLNNRAQCLLIWMATSIFPMKELIQTLNGAMMGISRNLNSFICRLVQSNRRGGKLIFQLFKLKKRVIPKKRWQKGDQAM